MTVQVGGINIAVGATTKQAQLAFKVMSDQLRDFQTNMKNIRLEGAIKGNPFSAVQGYMKASSSELTSIFNQWKTGIQYVKEEMGILAETSRMKMQQIIKTYEEAKRKLDQLKDSQEKGGALTLGAFGVPTTKTFTKREDFEKDKEGNLISKDTYKLRLKTAQDDVIKSDRFKKALQEYKGISSALDKVINKTIRNIDKGTGITMQSLNGYLAGMRSIIAQEAPKIKAEFENVGQVIKSEMARQQGANFRAQLKESGSISEARKRRVEATKDLLKAEAKLNAEAKAGIETSRLQANLAKLYSKQQQKGAFLKRSQLDLIEKEINLTLEVNAGAERAEQRRKKAIATQKNN